MTRIIWPDKPYKATIQQMPLKTQPAFLKLCDNVVLVEGGVKPACRALGITTTVYHALRDKQLLTNKQARKILDGYKRWKRELQQ